MPPDPHRDWRHRRASGLPPCTQISSYGHAKASKSRESGNCVIVDYVIGASVQVLSLSAAVLVGEGHKVLRLALNFGGEETIVKTTRRQSEPRINRLCCKYEIGKFTAILQHERG